MDLCLNFHVGFIVTNNFQRRLVMDSREVVAYYVRRGAAVLVMVQTAEVFVHLSCRCQRLCACPDAHACPHLGAT